MFDQDVLGHGQVPGQRKLLVDDRNALLDGIARRVDPSRLSVEKDLAALMVIGSGKDLHQRRLARAVLARLAELGPQSQNALGRETALDAATIKGVVDRLARQGLVSTFPDPDDRRRLTVDLSEEGRAVFLRLVPTALEVSARTLGPLSELEQRQLLDLLMRLA